MGRVAAVGERTRVAGLALTGVTVVAAEDPHTAREAWRSLPPDVTLVILTPAAADALGPAPQESVRPLTVVMPS
ncbi:V-type ATP synthase subunit F [Streptomyces milbemycinicus]|uniref:V-type ATP synthase subunit F n=1 Tax=Streptomyces milbemycinicus TaxID=476552 RepID=A0ABW8LL65_9ACTN